MIDESMIDKDKMIPPRTYWGNKRKYPFKEMDVGDSFFIAVEKGKKARMQSILFGCCRSQRRTDGSEFTSRSVCEDGEEGIRVWRIK